MFRPAVLAAVLALSASASASAREQTKVFDVPSGNPVIPTAVPSVSLTLDLGLGPFVKTAGLMVPAQTSPLNRQAAQAQSQAQPPIPIQIAAPALPASAVVSGQRAQPLSAAMNPSLAADEGSVDASLDAEAERARRMFDGLDGRAAKLEKLPAADAGSQESRRFAEALEAAKRRHFHKEAAFAAVDAAQALFKKLGVTTQRLYDAETPGLRVVPQRGLSELNDLAADVFDSLGTATDYLPSVTAGATAVYIKKENRIGVARPDAPDFYLAYLHELRHAWYSSLLARGVVRLFHLQMVGRGRLRIAPDAEFYENYVSFEELSTYPKTLKHMIAQMKRAGPEQRAELERLAGNRVWHMAELLKTAEHISSVVGAIDKRRGLDLGRLTEEDYAKTQLSLNEHVDWFELDLPRGKLYLPAPKREKKSFLGRKSRKGDHDEAAERLRLSLKLIMAMAEDMAPLVVDYHRAVRAGEWEKAGAAADTLIARAARAEKEWAAAQP